jgi:integral membrane protein
MNQISLFRIVAILEGISYLLLVFIAMPLKYFFQEPLMVKHVGMWHGVFFVLYVGLAVWLWIQYRWSTWNTALAVALSFVPFGTFYVTAKMLPQLVLQVTQAKSGK